MPARSSIPAPIREAATWLRRHWLHFLLAPPMLIVFTIIHESAHALVAILQGADIIEFVVWPTAEKWGHVRYVFPNGPPRSEWSRTPRATVRFRVTHGYGA